MDPRAQQHLDDFVAKYRASAPEGWVRIVSWSSRLADDSGYVDPDNLMTVEIAVVEIGGVLEQRYFDPDPQAGFDLEDLGEVLDETGAESWTRLEIEIDRDDVRLTVVTDPARPQLDSATDPFYDAVHEYLARNRESLSG